MYGAPPPMYRPEKNYIGEAFITLILYYVGFGIVGLIANIIFLNNANNDLRQGLMVRNKGCLQALLWVHVIGMIISCVVVVIVLLLGGFSALMSY